MNKIRITYLLLAAILGVFSILGGCASSSDDDDDDGGIVETLLGPAPVSLGTAGNFAIFSKAGVTNVPTSAITGDIGVSPATEAAITGFTLVRDVSDTFSTTVEVIGKVYASDQAVPTPDTLITAIADIGTAYDDAAGRTTPDGIDLGAGDIGGMTLEPGLYKWATPLAIPTDVTLSGKGVWIFQVDGTLTVDATVKVVLINGAQAKNIYWQVSGAVTLGATSELKGTILGFTGITLGTGATLNGRALAQTAVTLDQNTITRP